MNYIAGIDEVGRGPIAGPVTVCCVWGEKRTLQKVFLKLKKEGLTDSKKLPKIKREYFACVAKRLKKEQTIDYVVVSIAASVIDAKGISYAIKKAIQKATKKCNHSSAYIFLDGGLKAPLIFKKQKTVIRGDMQIPIISLASVVAKVHRDAYMQTIHKKYPMYGFNAHMGYGTQAHYRAIVQYGTTSVHRKTWINK